MSTDARIFSSFDDFEDFQFDPSLRIPPLQEPIPLIPSGRPSPLEPNARVPNDGAQSATAKLTSRSKALAEAKSIGEDETSALYAGPKGQSERAPKSLDTVDTGRKRQKLDFVQLPNPTSRAKANKPPPFRPVPVLLNKLHEPPPSAALFPPIAPSEPHEDEGHSKLDSLCQTFRVPAQSKEEVPAIPDQTTDTGGQGRTKRTYLRGRRNWTENETADLLSGVGIYGVGKWKKILHHKGFTFHPERTTVDLKDRYRTCRMNEEKALERHAVGDNPETPLHSPTKGGHSASDGQKEPETTADKKPSKAFSNSPEKPKHEGEHSFHICTPGSYPEQPGSPRNKRSSKDNNAKPLPRWTSEEDANLSKGYQRYGFQWTTIAKDSELNLSHRTGTQVRDRFRLRFPAHYQASIPLPLPDIPKRAPRPKSSRSRGRDIDTDANTENDSRGIPHTPPAQFTFIVHDSSKPPECEKSGVPPKSTQTDQRQQPEEKGPMVGSAERALPSQRDVFKGLNVQPLPDLDASQTEQSPSPSQSQSQSSGERSRQTSAEAEEAHHLGILGLLNEEDTQGSRLPSFKYAFEDDWGSNNVTLPPLLWEDMASRPIFDLE